jgi:hypothetical protein
MDLSSRTSGHPSEAVNIAIFTGAAAARHDAAPNLFSLSMA